MVMEIADFRETRRILGHRASHVRRPRSQFAAMDDWNSPTTKLLTLLNVSAAKSSKQKFFDHQGSPTPKQKLNKRRVEIHSPDSAGQAVGDMMEATEPEVGEAEQGDSPDDVEVGEAADVSDAEGV